MAANAAIYAPSPDPIPLEKLRLLAEPAMVSAEKSQAGAVTAYHLVWNDVRVTLNLLPTHEMALHLQGFQGYVTHLAGSEPDDSIQELLDRIKAVELVHGMIIEPGYDEEGKVQQLILGLLQHYQALLFAENSVYDEEGNFLIGPEEEDEDTMESDAEEENSWEPSPNQLERAERSKSLLRQRGMPLYQGPLFVEDDQDVSLRPSAEVARRTLVLWAVAQRGEGMPLDKARGLIERAGLWDAVSRAEKAFLEDPKPDALVSGRFVWRLESVWVLLWSLGHVEDLGAPESYCDVPRLVKLLRPQEADPGFIDRAILRPVTEILDAQDLAMRIHWAIRNAWLQKQPVPKNLDWISKAERMPVEECPAVGIAEQRHHTLNWLTSFGGDDWDNIDTST